MLNMLKCKDLFIQKMLVIVMEMFALNNKVTSTFVLAKIKKGRISAAFFVWLMLGELAFHLFQFYTFGFFYPPNDEENREEREERIDAVSTGQAER